MTATLIDIRPVDPAAGDSAPASGGRVRLSAGAVTGLIFAGLGDAATRTPYLASPS
ncbi:MAG TPA: hypothetical protein VFH03_18920 [Actinoplanes sp.]|nr:hypothetical protein [Actinoplanes sp.]